MKLHTARKPAMKIPDKWVVVLALIALFVSWLLSVTVGSSMPPTDGGPPASVWIICAGFAIVTPGVGFLAGRWTTPGRLALFICCALGLWFAFHTLAIHLNLPRGEPDRVGTIRDIRDGALMWILLPFLAGLSVRVLWFVLRRPLRALDCKFQGSNPDASPQAKRSRAATIWVLVILSVLLPPGIPLWLLIGAVALRPSRLKHSAQHVRGAQIAPVHDDFNLVEFPDADEGSAGCLGDENEVEGGWDADTGSALHDAQRDEGSW